MIESNCFELLSKLCKILLCGFEEKAQKPDFLAKNGKKRQKMAKREFFSKIRLEHFFILAKMQLCVKFQKNMMRRSPDIASRTNEHTNGQDS